MKISKLLALGLVIYLVAIWVCFANVGPSKILDVGSMLLMSALVVVMLVVLQVHKRSGPPVVLLLIFTVLALFGARFLVLINFPQEVDFQASIDLQVKDMNAALTYLLVGTILAAIAIRVGSAFAFSSSKQLARAPHGIRARFSVRCVFLLGMVLLAAQAVFVLRLGVASSYIPAYLGPYRLITHLVNLGVLLAIIITVAGEQWRFSTSSEKRLVCIYVIMYALFQTLVGSRAGLYGPAILFLAYMLVRHGDFRIRLKPVLVFVAAGMLSVFIVFVAGTLFRGVWFRAGEEGTSVSLSGILQGGGAGSPDWSPERAVLSVSHRVNGLDPLMAIMSDRGMDSREFLSPANDLKNIVNNLVLGNPFPEAIPAARAFPVIYRNWSVEAIRVYYHSEMYTLWGICYAEFGFLGGFVALFVICLFISWLYGLISSLASGIPVVLKVWWIYFGVYSMFLSYGLDTWVSEIIYALLAGVTYLWILRCFPPEVRSKSCTT